MNNKADFDLFVERLRYWVKGEGVSEHITANPIFLVQKRVLVYGIDLDYADQVCYVDGENHNTYFNIAELIDQCGEDKLDSLAFSIYECSFSELDDHDKRDLLENNFDITVTGYYEQWQYVSAHFTKEAAESFISRKTHDYKDGLRVYVDSQYFCTEFCSVVNALLDGKIKYIDEV